MKRYADLIAEVCAVFFLVLCMGIAQAQPLPPPLNAKPNTTLPLKLTQAELTATVTERDGEATQTHALGMQQLPWRWDRTFARQRGLMQFRLEVPLDAQLVKQLQASDKGLGLSASNMGNRYRLRVNSSEWTYVGWDEPTTQFRQKPRWHMLAAKELRPGNNVIELEIKAEPANDAGLSIVELGEAEASLKAHTNSYAAIYSLAVLVAVLSFLVCFLALVIGGLTREKFFWVAGLGEAAFFLRQLDWWIEYPPVPTWIFNGSRALLFAWYTGLMCWITLILVKKQAPWLERCIKAYMYAVFPVIVFGAYVGEHRIYPIGWGGIAAIMVIACAVRITYHAWRDSDAAIYIYTFGGWVALIFALYDYAGELLPTGFGQLLLGNYSLLVLSIALCVVIVQRYLLTRKALDDLATSRNLQAETATYRERQRMMQDIHDSVGSQLVALLGLVNSSAPHAQIKTHTAQALDELRMAVDAISSVDGELAVVLGSLRHRLQPRLEAAQLHLVWMVDELPKFTKLTHHDIQHIQRILLEVISNIIQHANATQVMLSARYDSDARVCRICISDDGTGFHPGTTTGRGLINIQHRAELLSATLSITQNEPRGTVVTLGVIAH